MTFQLSSGSPGVGVARLALTSLICYASKVEEDKRLQAAGALVAIIGLVLLVIQFSGSRTARNQSAGPGWSSRLNPFGSAPSADPAPAGAAPTLAPPERMMTNAAKRLFSSPTSAGSTGGLAGAEPAAAPADASNASMNMSHLAGNASMNIPGGGSSFGSPQGGGSRFAAPARRGSGEAGSAGGAGLKDGGTAGSGGGPSPGGDTKAAANGAAAFSSAATGSNPGGSRLNPMGADGIPPKGGDLNDMSSTAFGGGSGGEGSGGEWGGGGGGRMGGGAPNAKPKESAGPPGVDKGGGPASAAASGSPGTTANGTSQGGSNEGLPSEKRLFSLKKGGPAVVETFVYQTNTGTAIEYIAGMMIDADNKNGKNTDGDPKFQPRIAFQGAPNLDGQTIPFIVIPGDFKKSHPEVKLGDYATITYKEKTIHAIVADIGPDGVLGEASPAAARSIGVDANGVSGGLQTASVRYTIYAGSGKNYPIPQTVPEVNERGRRTVEAAGPIKK